MFMPSLKILSKALEAAYPSLVLGTLVSCMPFQAIALFTPQDSEPYEKLGQFVHIETEPQIAPLQAVSLM